jgi:hypothetical protein
LGTATWALIIIWAGVVFLLRNLGTAEDPFLGLDWDNVWAWILLGAGVLIGLEILLRLVIPAYRRPVGGRIVLAAVFIVVGAGGIINVSLWPLIIIAIGIALLLGYFTGPRNL